jgi:hypothetical protein
MPPTVDNYFTQQYIPEDNSELVSQSLQLFINSMWTYWFTNKKTSTYVQEIKEHILSKLMRSSRLPRFTAADA